MNPNSLPACERIGAVFADALIEIVQKTTGLSLDVVSTKPDGDFSGVIGSMNLGGRNACTVFVSAEEADLRVFCSLMTGLPERMVTKEEACDALLELVNMLAGNTKLLLGHTTYSFTPSTPYLIDGQNMSIVTKKRVAFVTRSFASESISMKLKILFAD